MKPAPSRKRILGFLVRTAVLYTLASLAWPALKDGYSRGFRYAGELFFGSFGAGRSARFRDEQEHPYQDVRVVLRSRDLPQRTHELRLSSERTGYRPTALLLALLLATPNLLWRRAWLLLVGLCAIHAFIALRVFLVLLQGFALWKPFGPSGQPALDPWIPLAALDALVLWVWQETTSNYLVPLLLWACLALRHDTFAATAAAHSPKAWS